MLHNRARHGRDPAESGRFERRPLVTWGWRKILWFMLYGLASWVVLVALILGGLEMLQTGARYVLSILERIQV